MERWASGILERIADSVANHACLVWFALLSQNGPTGVETINHLSFGIHTQVTRFDVLLGIVPGASTVVQEGCDDNTTHCSDHQQTCFGLWTEDRPNCNGSRHGYKTRENHGSQCSASADVYTTRVVRVNTIRGVLCHNLRIFTELAAYLFNHTLSSSTHGADCQCAKEEDQRETDQCCYEDLDISKVNTVDSRVVAG